MWILQSQGLLSAAFLNISRPAPGRTQTASVFSGTFPFSVGNSWHYVYWVAGSVSDDQQPMQPLMGDYTEQVTQVTAGSREDVHI